MRVLVTTRADLYERRKEELIARGYEVEEERPTPVNGFCSFVGVRKPSASDELSEHVAQALDGSGVARG